MLAAQGFRVTVPHLRGTTGVLSDSVSRSGQQGAIGKDVIYLMHALHTEQAVIAGYDWRGRTACVDALLCSERVVSLVTVGGNLVQDSAKTGVPISRKSIPVSDKKFFFTAPRGYARLTKNRAGISRVMLEGICLPGVGRCDLCSPGKAVRQSRLRGNRHLLIAAAPDLGVGYTEYDDREAICRVPTESVCAITLDGEDDGVARATNGKGLTAKCRSRRIHRTIAGAGNNLPQEASAAFAHAVATLARTGNCHA